MTSPVDMIIYKYRVHHFLLIVVRLRPYISYIRKLLRYISALKSYFSAIHFNCRTLELGSAQTAQISAMDTLTTISDPNQAQSIRY